MRELPAVQPVWPKPSPDPPRARRGGDAWSRIALICSGVATQSATFRWPPLDPRDAETVLRAPSSHQKRRQSHDPRLSETRSQRAKRLVAARPLCVPGTGRLSSPWSSCAASDESGSFRGCGLQRANVARGLVLLGKRQPAVALVSHPCAATSVLARAIPQWQESARPLPVRSMLVVDPIASGGAIVDDVRRWGANGGSLGSRGSAR